MVAHAVTALLLLLSRRVRPINQAGHTSDAFMYF